MSLHNSLTLSGPPLPYLSKGSGGAFLPVQLQLPLLGVWGDGEQPGLQARCSLREVAGPLPLGAVTPTTSQ